MIEYWKAMEIFRRGIFMTIKQLAPYLSDQEAWNLVDEVLKRAKSFDDVLPIISQVVRDYETRRTTKK